MEDGCSECRGLAEELRDFYERRQRMEEQVEALALVRRQLKDGRDGRSIVPLLEAALDRIGGWRQYA